MPLTTSKPEIIDGVEYPYLGLSMAMAPDWRPTGMGAMVAVTLFPYRITETGTIERAMRDGQPVDRCLSFGDAFALEGTDPDIATAIAGILSAVQGYITAKEI